MYDFNINEEINKNDKFIYFNNNQNYITPFNEIIKNYNNIYIVESVSGKEKEENKDYKIRKIKFLNDNVYDYDNSYKIKYISKLNLVDYLNNDENYYFTYFISRDAFIEYYYNFNNIQIVSEEEINKIKDRIKQKKYRDIILPTYQLKSKEKNKEYHFYTLEEIEILDIILKYFELDISKLNSFLYDNDKYFYNFIYCEIYCMHKKLTNYNETIDENFIYNDYKFYYIPFLIYEHYKNNNIKKEEYIELIKFYKKSYNNFKKNQKYKEQYNFNNTLIENKQKFYKTSMLKVFEDNNYISFDIEEYIDFNNKLINYQINNKKYFQSYMNFFNDKILTFLYFTDKITKNDFINLSDKIKKIKYNIIKKSQKYDNIYLNTEDENIIYNIFHKTNYRKIAVGYIELYKFTKIYYKNNNQNNTQYKNNIDFIHFYDILKKILI